MRGRTPGQTIETHRLTLRPPRMDDAPALAAGIGNYDVARWLGAVPFPYGVEDAERFIAQSAGAKGGSKARRWLIFEGADLVGGIGIDGELGFWLARPAWGRGLATEAADAVIDLHFADRGAGPLVSGHFLFNERSARVLDKLGFRDDGLITLDARVLGQEVPSRRAILTRADWQARRQYQLRTRRLSLRELRRSDGRGLHRILGAPDAAPLSRPEVDRWIAANAFRGRPVFSAAICGRFGRLIGQVGLQRSAAGPLALAFAVAPGSAGRGYATEAAAAFVADMQRRFGLTELLAAHPREAPAGGAVLRKLGFVETGAGQGYAAGRLEAGPNVNYRLTMGGEGAVR